MGKKNQLLQAYMLSGIDRNLLTNFQIRYVDKIISLLIRKCNQNDESIENMAEALEEISDVIRDDPLFND